jgi:hypothetical protein
MELASICRRAHTGLEVLLFILLRSRGGTDIRVRSFDITGEAAAPKNTERSWLRRDRDLWQLYAKRIWRNSRSKNSKNGSCSGPI